MPFSNNGLQVQEYVYDFAVDGGVYTTAFDLSAKAGYAPLPTGAVVVDVVYHVNAAVTGSSSTIIVGDGTDDDGYVKSTAEATLVANYCAKGVGALIWDDTNDVLLPNRISATATTGRFIMTVGTASLTAGKICFMVHYLMPSV